MISFLFRGIQRKKKLFWLAFLPFIFLFLIPLILLLNTSATPFFVSSAFLFLQRLPLSIISVIHSTSSPNEAVNEIFYHLA